MNIYDLSDLFIISALFGLFFSAFLQNCFYGWNLLPKSKTELALDCGLGGATLFILISSVF
tara:strand:+ start:95 stop:277 length:183 start_codon:yes stop_codon:yes gene_type:complete